MLLLYALILALLIGTSLCYRYNPTLCALTQRRRCGERTRSCAGMTMTGTSTDADTGYAVASVEDTSQSKRALADSLKSRMFARAAACDRGFGATAQDRTAISNLINDLRQLMPIISPAAPTHGLYPNNSTDLSEVVPIEGVWQMVYTTAFDVLQLGVNPVAMPQGKQRTVSEAFA
jgi:hypothetical protein